MTIKRSMLKKLAFSTFLLTLPLNAAFAADPAVAERVKSMLAAQGVDISWTGVSGDDSNVTLQAVSIKPAAEKEALPIGDVKLEGVSEADGGFDIATVSTSAFSRTQDDVTLILSPFIIHDMKVPAEGNTDPLGSLMMYKSAELSNMTVKKGEKTAFSMDGLAVEITPPADGKAMNFTANTEKFTADLSLVDDPKSKEAIEALGYQNISGNIDMAGSWQPSDGKMELSKYDISVENAGTLGMTFNLGGYTVDFIKSMQEMQKKLASQPEGADNSAQGMAMLGLLQQLSFNGASIRYQDDSLTGKVLDYVGKQQGMSGKDVANQAKAIVPFGMAQLNNPELTAEVSSAVNTFLDDPKSLEISAEPPSSVPFALIMAGAMSNPLDLPKTLGVKVKANQD
ncbi:hypothetical protein EN828_19180 [Mesorhizobium sp. M2D.F.Ca.ET.185.01.1.1]|uniref:hypothetical protein n=1 Tax=unclassified Mesorhizobium TaxID=325217 RepID=UPI000FCA0881|nr:MULTISPECIES: hypothetical protein [unclassified Mesorhizobium]TGP79071.1 hypothetical protein EN870_16555 [bacterium M00.F.Ca.ET.227.01.1.1]TGP89401.1 hypothetical protein EN864_19790 [bacterium M00.F.Ca.ET.221.01.1.1]TGP94771.1 hypothetical protein EN865_15660 [bacterium M00.F.Ca.ET.222.01.1.1]TGU03511.1 hypothetical protein EN806_42135 [bacterium M00.F.Ca.ET.163.01.1.1]TGU28397.1 hypothetical protein EN799_36595 [bacterium M00.F.Ca.ET.156.01.1.1]TGU45758.1 hypothetical protein EN789_168